MNDKIADVDPGWEWDDVLPLSPACRVGDLIFVSGQVAVDAEGRLVGAGDIEAQVRQCLVNIASILDEEGAGLDDIARLGVFLTDRSHYPSQIKVRKEFFRHLPAATVVTVAALGMPEWMVEIEAIAVRR